MYSLRCAAVDKAGNAYDTVNIVDEDGVSSTVNLQDGDNLIDFSVNRNGSTFALNDYSKIKFKVPEGVNQQVAILCADCSIGTDGGTNTTDFIYKGITVSSNAFILFFENKPLFYGVLGVVAAAIIVPTGFVIYKKKRKTKKEASEQ